jgi:hypothetical protein
MNPDPGVSGHITMPTTWTGTVKVTGAVIVDPNITLTIAPGTTVNVAGTAGITVNGTIDASGGTKAAPITIHGDNSPHFGGVEVPMGGVVKYSYVTQDGGGVHLSGTASFTAADSVLSNEQGDYLTMAGGTVNVMYSILGEATGTTTTHCNMHFDAGSGAGNMISFTHSIIGGASYGIMFSSGNAADFTYDNWINNMIEFETYVGSPTSADLSNSYFQGGTPTPQTGSTFTTNNMSATPLDATMVGPR